MSDAPPLRLPPRAADAHKGAFGRVVLVGGSRGMCGSIALSSIAALHCGSGLVSAAIPDRCLESVAAWHPAVMTIPLCDDARGRFALGAATDLAKSISNIDAIGCGPGMTTERGSLQMVERLLQHRSTPRVFDADAINCLAILDWPRVATEETNLYSDMILSPHPGELERLTGISPGNREGQIQAAEMLADQTGAVIIVKGGPTVVVNRSAGGEPVRWTNTNGNPGMATAGSGDVLTGILTSLLGQRLSAWDAARLGVWLHGRAGDLASKRFGQIGMTAREILEEIPAAVMSAES